MKNMITILVLFASISAFARGGGDAGGGPTLRFKVALDATKIDIANISLTKIARREKSERRERPFVYIEDRDSENMVKVIIKYKIPVVKCIERENRMDRCYNGFDTKYNPVLFKADLFPSEMIRKLSSRKLFSKKKPYIALAKENLSVDVLEGEESQIVTVEVY